jgi:RNA polymerase sigma-70 factor (ECF subfamily)
MTGDAELVERAKRGDRTALEQLLERHLPMVYRFVAVRSAGQRADVEDIVQESLIAAAGSLRNLRAERDGSVPKWLLAIARHKIADHRRRLRPILQSDLDDMHTRADADADVADMAASRDRDRRLHEALGALTPEQAEVLVLRFIVGLELVEVAAVTGRTVGAVKSLQHRGLASLEKMLVLAGEDWG